MLLVAGYGHQRVQGQHYQLEIRQQPCDGQPAVPADKRASQAVGRRHHQAEQGCAPVLCGQAGQGSGGPSYLTSAPCLTAFPNAPSRKPTAPSKPPFLGPSWTERRGGNSA